MGKPTNIVSTSHAQAAEFAALAGADTTALKDALAKQTELTAALEAELAAEKEAHAATSAALEAATTVKTQEQPAA